MFIKLTGGGYMISCDWHDVAMLIDNLSYSDICINNGFNTNFCTTSYQNQKLSFIEGRGYVNPLSLLDNLQVEYDIINTIDIKEYIEQNSLKNCILYAPIEIIEGINHISPSLVQLSFVYSSFLLKKINPNLVSLTVGTGILEKKFYVELKDFLKLFQLESVPLKKSGFLVEIKTTSSPITKEIIFSNCKKSLNSMLTGISYTRDQMNIVGGINTYSNYIQYLYDYDFISNSKLSYIKRFINASIINSGGQAFYRYDFFYSLKNAGIVEEDSYLNSLFIELVNSWRKNCRFFRKIATIENPFSINLIDNICILLKKIELLETQISEIILEKIN